MKRKLLSSDLQQYVENEILDFGVFYDKETKSLSISKMNVNDADIEFIASCLAQHPDTTTLSLNNNLISDAGAEQLALVLQKYSAITTLNLQFNNIGNDGVKALIDALNSIKERSIQLDLTWNQAISQKGITQLKLYSMREGSSHRHHVFFHDFDFHPVTDCPKLEDLAFKALIKRGSLFKDEDKLSDITASQPRRIASVLEQHLTKLMPEFLQAVVDENEEKIKELLDVHPELLLCEPSNALVIESKLTWQKFYAENALKMAAKRKQFKMFDLLFSYIHKLEQDDEAVIAAKAEGISAWKCYCLYNNLIIIPEDYTSYIDQLINIIKIETFPNGKAVGRKQLSEKTELFLSELLDKLIPKNAVTLDDYLDVELFLLAAFKACSNDTTLIDPETQSAFCIRVLGLIQSVLSPEIAKIFCTGLQKVYSTLLEAKRQGNNVIDCVSYSDLANQHQLREGESFYRISRDSNVGLGFDSLCDANGDAINTGWVFHSSVGLCLQALHQIMLSKNSKFLENYATISVSARPETTSCRS